MIKNLYEENGYLVNAKGIPVHWEVYEKNFGKRFKGWHIHHCDYDKHNNCPKNLVAIPPELHDLIHDNYPRKKAPGKKYIESVLIPYFINKNKKYMDMECEDRAVDEIVGKIKEIKTILRSIDNPKRVAAIGDLIKKAFPGSVTKYTKKNLFRR